MNETASPPAAGPHIIATIDTRTYDRVSTAYVKTPEGPAEAGRVFARDALDNGYWYIHGLYVKPGYRQQGIARQLMDEVIRFYGFDRLELICADVPDADPKRLGGDDLAAWYQRLGFVFGPSANTSRMPRVSDSRRMYRKGARGI